MAYKRRFETIKDLIYFYISSYYEKVSKKPSLRVDAEAHSKFILHINYDYQTALKLREKQFNYEEHKDKFIEAIELRTQFQKKLQDIKEKKERNKALFQKVSR